MYLRHYLGHRRDTIASRSICTADEANIITTWEIAFRRIASRKSWDYRDAVELIHICAFMHFDCIPEAVFQRPWPSIATRKGRQDSTGLVQVESEWDDIRLREALSILYNYSIIDRDPKKCTVSLHPVIQRWAQDRLSEADRKRWLNAAVAVLAQCISPLMEASGRKFRRSLLPHIESCLRALKTLNTQAGPNTIERAAKIERFA